MKQRSLISFMQKISHNSLSSAVICNCVCWSQPMSDDRSMFNKMHRNSKCLYTWYYLLNDCKLETNMNLFTIQHFSVTYIHPGITWSPPFSFDNNYFNVLYTVSCRIEYNRRDSLLDWSNIH